MIEKLYLFYLLLFIVAFLYASVGHGGASGYLALMAIFAVSPAIMKPTALLLNLFVSSISFVQFYRGNYFKWKSFWPFALASIPMSFIGGMMAIENSIYKKILALLLLVPVIRFLFISDSYNSPFRPINIPLSIAIGGSIGLLSGMIGIGGGIILSPALLLLKWADQKQTAALSAAFIFVNSLAGLIGQMIKGIEINSHMLGYVGFAFAGGICGAYFGAHKFPQRVLKHVLGFVLALAAFKLLFTTA
jgi:uncharacterized membrane protein YfcA